MVLISKGFSDLISTSNFGILTEHGLINSGSGIEIDRIQKKEGDNLVLFLRIRNTTPKPVKIFSFLVSDFKLTEGHKIEKVLEHGWLQCSEVSYKSLNEPTKESMVFLQRDQNHFSFKKEYGYLDESIISEWFTLIKKYGEDLFIGAVTTANQFTQIFTRREGAEIRVRVTCQYDGLTLKPGQVVKSEKIFFGVGEENKIKNDFAKKLSREMNVGKVKEKIKAMCCSYYWNGNSITEESINAELTALENLPEHLDLDYFQIDAGYTKHFGDWLDYKERFPHGFEPIVARIRKLGYKPAIWFSPFAINPATKLHDYHPEWFLKGIDHGHFDGRLTSPFDTVLDSFDLEVLDPTNKEVLEYLRKVLIHFKSLGFELFKTDFTYPVCLANNFSKHVTRAEALRHGFEFIREVVGPETLILTCISQLSPLVGIVDFVRTGIDTLNPFVCGISGINRLVNEFMLEKNISESEERIFLNGKVWRADPDMLIFRNGTGIDNETIEKHKKFAKENNMCLWVGDSVARMDNDTKDKLVKFFHNA